MLSISGANPATGSVEKSAEEQALKENVEFQN